MDRFRPFAASFLALQLLLVAAPSHAASTDPTERDIASIRKRYYALQKRLSSLEHVQKKLCTNPEEHWTCTDFQAWIENDRIVKLEYGGGEEGFWGSTELFLDARGEPYFLFHRGENGREEPSEIDETRTYLKDGTIIRNLCRSGTSDDIDAKPQTPCAAGKHGIDYEKGELERFRKASGYR